MTTLSLRARLARFNIPQVTLGALASTRDSIVHPSDVTRWVDGIPGVSEAKTRRLQNGLSGLKTCFNRLIANSRN